MKRLVCLSLVAVFTLSFVAGALVSPSQATVPLCWKASDCDYQLNRVRVCCQYYKPNGEPYVQCFWDYYPGEYFALWCQ